MDVDQQPSCAVAGTWTKLDLRVRTTPPSVAAEAPGPAPSRFVTVFGSIRPYERAWLSRDVVAGITLAALAITEVMGYKKIVGTPERKGVARMTHQVESLADIGSSRH